MTAIEVRTRPAAAALTPNARYATLMTHAEPGLLGTQRVEFAARLARQLDARLIGVAALSLAPYLVDDSIGGYAPDERVASLVRGLEADLKEAGESFRRDAAGADVELRTVEDYPAVTLARNARAADLIVMSPKSRAPAHREPDPGEVAVRAGKPVLIAPLDVHRLELDTTVFAWNDSRECRRTAQAALPCLQRARRVVVCGVCEPDRNEAVGAQLAAAAALKRQGVAAEAEICEPQDGVANILTRTVRRHDADLLVMGAYGHSRAAELVFGGTTQHFVRTPPCCVLMAH